MDPSPPSRVLLADGLLDLHVGAIERGDGRVSLTTRELELLRYLAAREGQDVSREELLVEVWEYAPGVESRTVDTTVKRLRKKLERDASDPRHLLSVHGVGYRLVAATDDTPAPAPVSNLPDDADLFIGRAAERAEIAAALQRGEALITLRGPGGVGKSRLAREVARDRAAAGDAVLFVDVGGATTDAEVREEIATALGLRAAPDDDALLEAVSELVPALLILDDCDAARDALRGLVPRFAGRVTGAALMTTGLQSLGLGAREIEVQIAPLPPVDAVALFAARAGLDLGGGGAGAAGLSGGRSASGAGIAAAVSGDVSGGAVGRSNAGSESSSAGEGSGEATRSRELPADHPVARLVAELDCLPLAIELAAARAAVLSPEEILARLDQRFRLLASRSGTGRAARLRDTIAWSWDLLDDDERAALIACATFRGGFDVHAAEVVVEPANADVWVLDLVDSLEAKSLLQRRAVEGRSRFFLLNGVRAFAEEAGSADGSLDAARARHLAWAVATGRALTAEADADRSPDAWARLAAERTNLQEAWAHAGPGADKAELTVILGRLHERAGSTPGALESVDEALAELGIPASSGSSPAASATGAGMEAAVAAAVRETTAAAAAHDVPAALVARMLLVRGQLHRALNHLAEAGADGQLAEAVATEAGDLEAMGFACILAAEIETDLGHADLARAQLARAASRLPSDPTPARLALTLREGLDLFHHGQLDEAEAKAQWLFGVARRDGRLDAEGSARRLLCALRLRTSRMDEAWEHGLAARKLFAELGDQVKEALVLEILGVAKAFVQEHAAAAHWHGQAVQIYRRLGRRHELPRALGNLARDLLHSGDEAEARRIAIEAVAVARGRGALRQELEARTLVGTVALSEGRIDDAITAYEHAIDGCREAQLATLRGSAEACVAIALLADGRPGDALPHVLEAVTIYESAGDRIGLAHHLATAAACAAELDDLDAAAAHESRAREVVPDPAMAAAWLKLCGGFVAAARARAGVDREANRKRWHEAAHSPTNSAFTRVLRGVLRQRAP